MADPCFEKKSRSQRPCAVEQQREGILVPNESALEGFGTRGSCIVFIVSLYLHPVSVLKHKPGLNRADLEKVTLMLLLLAPMLQENSGLLTYQEG